MARQLHIDVYFDLICPWCLIGKGLLKQALARLADTDPDVQVEVQWHSVQLIPNVPPEGWPYREFYLQRLGGADAVRARQAQVRAAAAVAGETIEFERITTFPNTAAAHRLLAIAVTQLQPAAFERLLQRLFEAYFQRGEDLGSASTLAAIAAEFAVVLPSVEGEVPAVPPSGLVSGVPFFVFNRQRALSGAQPVDALFAAMQQSLAEDAVAH